MTVGARPGFWRVARREAQWLAHDRVALILIFGVPLFAFVVLTIVFSQPVIRGLGVAIVDADRSDASRALAEYVAASPSLNIVDRASDLATAARDIRSGKAIGATSLTFVSEASLKNKKGPSSLGLSRELVAVKRTRKIGKRDMVLNDAMPKIAVDPETYTVKADGEHLTCEPAKVLPMAQRYFLF